MCANRFVLPKIPSGDFLEMKKRETMFFTRSLLFRFLLGPGSELHDGPERLGRSDHIAAARFEPGEVEDAEDVGTNDEHGVRRRKA